MSLMGRARCAEGEVPVYPTDRSALAGLLRESVYERISANDIAAKAARNLQLARSEVSDREGLVGELLDGMFGLGPIEALLDDESVSEIMVNATQAVYFERQGVLYRSSQRFASDDQVRALIDRIIGPIGRRIDEASPTVDARLPQGHRVHRACNDA